MILDKQEYIDTLSRGSNKKVYVKCDVCGTEKYLSYRFYLKNIKSHDLYDRQRKHRSL